MAMEVEADPTTGEVWVSQVVTESGDVVFKAGIEFHGLSDDDLSVVQVDMASEGITDGMVSELSFRETVKIWEKQIRAIKKFNQRWLEVIAS
jgi:hypothetical protein